MDTGAEKIRVLLVDDEEDFLLSSAQALERRGFQVDVAPNGVTALEKIDRVEYQIVVLDVKMPDIDGLEVFRILRQRHPSLPVVMLTGHSSLEDAFQTSRDGIADYLDKPIDMDELARRLRGIVQQQQAQAESGDRVEGEGAGETVRVMVVDDETDFLQSVKAVLERRRLSVTTAESGEAALGLLAENLVDVIVLDVKMPGMSGLDVLRRVRRDYPSVQVILLSGHPSVDAAVEGVRLGASEYLQKPPDIEHLAGTIRKLHQEKLAFVRNQQEKLIEEIRRRYPD